MALTLYTFDPRHSDQCSRVAMQELSTDAEKDNVAANHMNEALMLIKPPNRAANRTARSSAVNSPVVGSKRPLDEGACRKYALIS